MCGIAGAIGRIDRGVSEAVRLAAQAQVHRGPDDDGFWQSGPSDTDGAVMAFRRLAIIDLSSDGHQPMVHPPTGNVIAFNGEIYNHHELRRELAAFGRQFRSQSDTEVVLAAYAQWGLEAFNHLRGMFAIALWDAHRRQLVLARDRVGIKPLFYCTVARRGGRALLFASELRALLATGLVDRHLSRAAIGSYVWNGFVPGPATIIDGIDLLPAGMLAIYDCTGARLHLRRYWRLPDAKPKADGVEELRHELHTAVQQHMVADVPVGVFLSGGIDSSAVVNLAAHAAPSGHRLRTFTIGFDEPGFDEAPHAERVARAVGTDHTTVRLTQRDFGAQLAPALRSLDQPTFDGINSYFVSRAVRTAGVTVALSGAGGDELFGGYRSFRDIPRIARLGRGVRRVPVRLLRLLARGVARAAGGLRAMGRQTRWGKLGDALATRGHFVGLYQTCYALFTTEFGHRLLPDGEDDGLSCGLPTGRFDELTAMVGDSTSLHSVSVLEMANFIGERLVRDIDAASMASSLETRVPLLDHRVIEAAAGVAESGRFAPLGKKLLLQQLAMPELDRAMFDRPKAGFVLPLDTWARQSLGDEVGRTLCDRRLCEACGLDVKATTTLWNAFAAASPGVYWSRAWAVFVLLWWAREHRATLA